MAAPKATSDSQRVDADTLVTLFPGALGAWKLAALERPLPPQSPEPRPLVRATYELDAQSAEITVSSVRRAGHGKPAREVYREGPPQRDGSMVVITLANGVAIAATSRTADVMALEALIHGVDLERAEALKPIRR